MARPLQFKERAKLVWKLVISRPTPKRIIFPIILCAGTVAFTIKKKWKREEEIASGEASRRIADHIREFEDDLKKEYDAGNITKEMAELLRASKQAQFDERHIHRNVIFPKDPDADKTKDSKEEEEKTLLGIRKRSKWRTQVDPEKDLELLTGNPDPETYGYKKRETTLQNVRTENTGGDKSWMTW